ncbi:MAG TPA: hypothetical protein VGF56_16170 [Rhizomicrobium sp.]|jgi:hypothetical protein
MPRKSAEKETQARREVSADVMMLTLSVAALTPVLYSIMAFTETARHYEQAVRESQAADAAALAALARAVDTLLSPPRRPSETVPNMPYADPDNGLTIA